MISRNSPSPLLLTILLAMNPEMRPSTIHAINDIFRPPLEVNSSRGGQCPNVSVVLHRCKGAVDVGHREHLPSWRPGSRPVSVSTSVCLHGPPTDRACHSHALLRQPGS